MYDHFLLLIFLLNAIVPFVDSFEASEVEALFSAPAPDDENSDEILNEHVAQQTNPADGEKHKESLLGDGTSDGNDETDEASKHLGQSASDQDEKQKQGKNQSDGAVETPTESSTPPEMTSTTTKGPGQRHDISDRRGWHVPMTGGDVIPPAIIPPEPEDTVDEADLNADKTIAAANDNRNWYVAHSVGDIMPAAIIPQEDDQDRRNGNDNTKNTVKTMATKEHPGSGASGSYITLVVLPLALMMHF